MVAAVGSHGPHPACPADAAPGVALTWIKFERAVAVLRNSTLIGTNPVRVGGRARKGAIVHLSPIIDLNPPWRRFSTALRRRRARRRLNRDLAGLTNKELSDLLAKAGIRRSDLFAGLEGAPRHRRLMGHMLVRFGIDRETACQHNWRSLAQAERACAQCANAGRCERWLAWGRTNNAPTVFCRNAGLFTQMRLDLARLTRTQPRTYALESSLAGAEAAHIAEAWTRLRELEERPFWRKERGRLG